MGLKKISWNNVEKNRWEKVVFFLRLVEQMLKHIVEKNMWFFKDWNTAEKKLCVFFINQSNNLLVIAWWTGLVVFF